MLCHVKISSNPCKKNIHTIYDFIYRKIPTLFISKLYLKLVVTVIKGDGVLQNGQNVKISSDVMKYVKIDGLKMQ